MQAARKTIGVVLLIIGGYLAVRGGIGSRSLYNPNRIIRDYPAAGLGALLLIMGAVLLFVGDGEADKAGAGGAALPDDLAQRAYAEGWTAEQVSLAALPVAVVDMAVVLPWVGEPLTPEDAAALIIEANPRVPVSIDITEGIVNAIEPLKEALRDSGVPFVTVRAKARFLRASEGGGLMIDGTPTTPPQVQRLIAEEAPALVLVEAPGGVMSADASDVAVWLANAGGDAPKVKSIVT